jgi:hypothetical protein
VEIPDGWQEVAVGRVQRGDKFLNLMTLQWDKVEEDDLGLDLILVEGDRTFDFLIREVK